MEKVTVREGGDITVGLVPVASRTGQIVAYLLTSASALVYCSLCVSHVYGVFPAAMDVLGGRAWGLALCFLLAGAWRASALLTRHSVSWKDGFLSVACAALWWLDFQVTALAYPGVTLLSSIVLVACTLCSLGCKFGKDEEEEPGGGGGSPEPLPHPACCGCHVGLLLGGAALAAVVERAVAMVVLVASASPAVLTFVPSMLPLVVGSVLRIATRTMDGTQLLGMLGFLLAWVRV